MNRFANEFGILDFYFIYLCSYFIYLCSTCVSDFMVLFRRLIMAGVVTASSSYSKNCFDWGVILFNSRNCFILCMYLFTSMYFVCLYICIHAGTSDYCFSFLPLL